MQMRHIVAVMHDGTKHEASGVHGGLSDRVAYEAEFGETVTEMRTRVIRQIEDDGKLKDDADGSAFSDTKIAFFPWRTLQRAGCDVGPFREFLEACEELIIEEVPDPTAPTLPSES